MGTELEVPSTQSRGARCRTPVRCGFTDGEKRLPWRLRTTPGAASRTLQGFDSGHRGRSPRSVFPVAAGTHRADPTARPGSPLSAGWLSHAREDHPDPHGELLQDMCGSESRGPDTRRVNELGDGGGEDITDVTEHRPALSTAPVLLSPSGQAEASLGQFSRLTTGPCSWSSCPCLQSLSPG